MIFFKQSDKFLAVLLSVFVLSACVGGGMSVKQAAKADANKERQLSQDESAGGRMLKQAREKVAMGKEENLPRFSPEHFKAANKLKAELEEDYTKFINKQKSLFGGVSESDVVELAKKVILEIDQGMVVKGLVQKHLKNQLEQKAFIDKLVSKEYGKEYRAIGDDLNDLIEDIEKKKSFAGLEKDRSKLDFRMHKLEVQIAYDRYVKKVKHRLSQLEKKDIPSSFLKAEHAIQKLESHVDRKPRDTEILEQLQNQAIKDTDLATVILNEVTRLRSTDKNEHEAFILSYYKILDEHLNPLVEENYYHIGFERQVKSYAKLIEQRMDSQSSDAALAEQQQRFDEERAALQAELEALRQQLQSPGEDTAQDAESQPESGGAMEEDAKTVANGANP